MRLSKDEVETVGGYLDATGDRDFLVGSNEFSTR
jgi:hypothetical protein